VRSSCSGSVSAAHQLRALTSSGWKIEAGSSPLNGYGVIICLLSFAAGWYPALPLIRHD
jgi:hypothetical protein